METERRSRASRREQFHLLGGWALLDRRHRILVDGIGQGVEGKHDVWAEMPRESLDRIHIVEATQTRIVGEAAGAYPKEAALMRYQREVILDPKGTLHIRDSIETREA